MSINPNASLGVVVENMELTPMRVKWGGVDIGGTLDNVELSVEYSKGEIKADQYGETIMDKRLKGTVIGVKMALAEVRDPTHWSYVFPSAELATSGSLKSITFRQNTGRSDRDNAKILQLHPVVLPDSDVSEDHVFNLAHPNEKSGIVYGPKDQSKLKLEFDIYGLILTGDGGRLEFYRFGTQSVAP